MAICNSITDAYESKTWTFHIAYKRKRYQAICDIECEEVYNLKVIRFVKKGKTYKKTTVIDEKIINAIDKIVQDYLYDNGEISFTNYCEED
jgi:hypothetical protein